MSRVLMGIKMLHKYFQQKTHKIIFIFIFFLICSLAQSQLIPFANWKTSSSPPTAYSLAHSTNQKTFQISWSAGIANGGANNCKLQFYLSPGTWVDITSAINLNCDSSYTNSSYTLNADGWKSSWGSTQIRVVRKSDSQVLFTFSQTLQCSSTSASGSSTPNTDENCNGQWDDSSGGGGDNLVTKELTDTNCGGCGGGDECWFAGISCASSATVYRCYPNGQSSGCYTYPTYYN